jgi:hypothetical protein
MSTNPNLYPDNTTTTTDVSYSSDRAVRSIMHYMDVQRVQTDRQEGVVLGTIHEPLAENIAAIRHLLQEMGYVALFRKNPGPQAERRRLFAPDQADTAATATLPGGEHVVQFGLGSVRPTGRSKPTVNIILFLLTVLTTLLIGSLQQNGNPLFLRDLATDTYVQSNYWRVLWQSLGSHNPLQLGQLVLGVPFSFALLLILGSHELGHYLTARRYGVDATLPFFLPIPHPLMGTMGAFIRIKSPIPSRSALVRLGVAGPLVGFIFAVPIIIVGLLLSRPVPLEAAQGNISLGSSLLFGWLSNLFFPHLPPGYDVSLHPLAFAGWLGLFVTALNLIPIGQLDGGHVAYVALGRYRGPFRILVLAAMVGLGFLWPGWFFWGILVLVLGMNHPPTQDEITPLRTSDKLLMAAAVLVFVLSFMPVPFPRG